MSEKEKKRSYLSSVFGCHCPRCRQGKLFEYPLSIKLKRNMRMNKTCPVCGQPTEIEVGFYYGTSYVSYVLTVLISVFSFIVWWLIIGMSLHDNRFCLDRFQCCFVDPFATLVNEIFPQPLDLLVCKI